MSSLKLSINGGHYEAYSYLEIGRDSFSSELDDLNRRSVYIPDDFTLVEHTTEFPQDHLIGESERYKNRKKFNNSYRPDRSHRDGFHNRVKSNNFNN